MKCTAAALSSSLVKFDTMIQKGLEENKEEKLGSLLHLVKACFIESTLIVQPKAFDILLTKLTRIYDFIKERAVNQIETGDAPWKTECDVVAATMIVDIFLGELPYPVIPEEICPAYVNTVKDILRDKKGCVLKLKCLMEKLPLENFNTLKFIVQFIVNLNQQNSGNRQTTIMEFLGVEIFRLVDEVANHRKHFVCNLLMELFVCDYNAIFERGSELSLANKSLRRRIHGDENGLDTNLDAAVTSYSGESVGNLHPVEVGPSVSLEPLSIIIPPLDKCDTDAVLSKVPILLIESLEQEQLLPLNHYHETAISQQSLLCHGRKDNKCKPSRENSLWTQSCCIDPESDHSGTIWETYCFSLNGSQDAVTLPDASFKENRGMKKWLDHLQFKPVAELSPYSPVAKCQEFDSFPDSGHFKNLHSLKFQNQLDSPLSVLENCEFLEEQFNSIYIGDNIKDKQENLIEETFESEVDPDIEEEISFFDNLLLNTSNDIVTKYKENIDTDKENCESKKHFLTERYHMSSKKCKDDFDWHIQCGNHFTLYHQGVDKASVLHSVSKCSYPLLELHPTGNEEINRSSEEDASNENSIAVFDFTFSHDHEDFHEPILSEHRHSWPLTRSDLEDPMLSPSFYYLKRTNSCEASLSPSAGTCLPYLGSTDPSIPPSLPKEQHTCEKRICRKKDSISCSIKHLTKKIHSLKKKIRHFEETFEADHCFRPSLVDKMKDCEIKKVITELAKLRKELRDLKEEQQLEQDCIDSTSTDCIRKVCNDMTKDQMLEEKVAAQKELLICEKIYGQPATKIHREMMHPLYDHYCSVKRPIGRVNYFENSVAKESATELQPILENVAMNFTSPERCFTSDQMKGNKSSVTETFTSNLLPEKDHICVIDHGVSDVPKPTEEFVVSDIKNSNLHELSLSELIQRQRQTRVEKRRLRKILHEFEDGFQHKNGKKAQKEDRIAVEPIYSEYKNAKGKLKLLEALVAKHELQHRI
ncbi:uncharacterized protein LOC143234046 isoform X2 [Tachypleus tridentatus]|uniref:uncharacterized protein LOC143234046 isoform X2 n=1 Tax=Tachypleus tridentatus TaxID=6853 RepID=UPI003FD557C5